MTTLFDSLFLTNDFSELWTYSIYEMVQILKHMLHRLDGG